MIRRLFATVKTVIKDILLKPAGNIGSHSRIAPTFFGPLLPLMGNLNISAISMLISMSIIPPPVWES